MGFEMPRVPVGSGEHPVALVVVSANEGSASAAFYARLFGWQVQPLSGELSAFVAPGGPAGAMRSNVPAGFPGIVPYVGVRDVDAMPAHVAAAGGSIERAPWDLPGVGRMARFRDPGGTLWGLTDGLVPGGSPRLPLPIGSNPKPPAGSICQLEMHAADGTAAARFFGDLFGWGTAETMPQYVAFDPGAGLGGVFQTHTPTLPALAYLYATDVGAKLAEVAAAGGKPQGEPMRMPGFATFGYFVDPSGTHMGLIGP